MNNNEIFYNKLVSSPRQDDDKKDNVSADKSVIDSMLNNIESGIKQNSEGFKDSFTSSLRQQIDKINKANIEKMVKRDNNIKKSIKQVSQSFIKKTNKVILKSIKSSLCNVGDCISETLAILSNVYKKTLKSIKSVKEQSVKFFKSINSTFGTFNKYFRSIVRSGLSQFDSLVGKLAPKQWNMIKYLFNNTMKVFSWIKTVGMAAIDFVWSGVKTIFKFAYNVTSTSIEYLYKGAKGFFGWWFKMLLNTIFNPGMWITNIPLFILITGAAISALSMLFSIGASIIMPLFETTFDIFKTVGGWIWDGITFVWEGIKKLYKGSYLEKNIIEPLWQSIENTDFYKSVSNIISTSYNFISNMYNDIKNSDFVKSATAVYNDIVSFFKNNISGNGGSTMLRSLFSSMIEKWPIPGNAKTFIESKFGFVLASAKTGGLVLLDKINQDIKFRESEVLRHKLEYEYISNSNLGKSQEEIESILKKSIEQYSNSLFTDLSSGDIKDLMKTVKANSEAIKSKKMGFVGKLSLSTELDDLERLKRVKQLMISGSLNAADPNTINTILDIINSSTTVTDTIKKSRVYISGNLSNLEFDISSIDKILDRANKNMVAKSTFGNVKDFTPLTKFEKFRKAYLNVGEVANYMVTSLLPIENTRPFANKAVEINTGQQLIFPLTPQTPEIIKSITSNDVLPTSIKITTPSKEVSAYSKKLPEPINNEDKKENSTIPQHITIFDETKNMVESYGIYTMSQLSKGSLR